MGPTQPPIQWIPGLSRGKATGPWRWPQPPSNAEVNERVELYLYSPFRPSWPILGWTWPNMTNFMLCQTFEKAWLSSFQQMINKENKLMLQEKHVLHSPSFAVWIASIVQCWMIQRVKQPVDQRTRLALSNGDNWVGVPRLDTWRPCPSSDISFSFNTGWC
jgi:hypothetical protein